MTDDAYAKQMKRGPQELDRDLFIFLLNTALSYQHIATHFQTRIDLLRPEPEQRAELSLMAKCASERVQELRKLITDLYEKRSSCQTSP